MSQIVVVGAGVFGVTAARELAVRGHAVTLVDRGSVPDPLAASTDISKVCRMEYGSDETYMQLMEEAFDGWRTWNASWEARGRGPLYHEVGVLMVRRRPLRPGDFEYESYQRLIARGHEPVRVDADAIARRYPAWAPGLHVDGFYNPRGGYAESGRVVEALLDDITELGVTVIERAPMKDLTLEHGHVRGVTIEGQDPLDAEEVVMATGAWAGKTVPKLGRSIRATAHPVLHLRPSHPELFRADHFPVFTADITRTGLYGFPLSREGVVKVATHALGRAIDPDRSREPRDDDIAKLRAVATECFPGLADAAVVTTRLCLYADTPDEDFWIAKDPEVKGLTIASGGSGHGFKFAPVLGAIIADAVEGRPHPILKKFRWRPHLELDQGREAARCHDQE